MAQNAQKMVKNGLNWSKAKLAKIFNLNLCILNAKRPFLATRKTNFHVLRVAKNGLFCVL